MNKKNGFTLVELLAVIVILAVILVIAVPSIISTINESRKGVLESSVKLIASTAESMKLSNNTLGVTEEITCSDVAQLTSEDYGTCKIDFVDGDAYVSIIGKGKFEGMAVLSGTVEKAEAIRTTGLELTDDGNIRYTGSNPSNYVEFGNINELWRIIGIFNVTTASGKTEKLMKIVRNESIGKYSWDSSESDVNQGYGVNQWGEVKDEDGNIIYEGADLMRELNTLYLNQESGTCYRGAYNRTTTCDFSTKGIGNVYKNMIEEIVWNIGYVQDSLDRRLVYNEERGTYCNDDVNRRTTWQGKVGLMYPSDYGFASIGCADMGTSLCRTNNWLYTGASYWTISPIANQSSGVLIVNNDGYIVSSFAFIAPNDYYGNDIRPSLYLKSNVSITSGEGTEQSPYKLSGFLDNLN